MGLDQYAYCRAKSEDYSCISCNRPHYWSDSREISTWRKHANLQGWMAELYRKRGGDADKFNGVEIELTWEDLNELERAVTHGELPATKGFFFGDGADDYYRKHDLEFIKKARAELFMGLKVFYNSSW